MEETNKGECKRMKYILTIDMAAASINTVLTDENDNQQTNHFGYEGVVFPTDDVTPDNIANTLINALGTLQRGLPGEQDVITEIHFVTGIANAWVALDEDFTPLTEVISGGDNRAAKYVDALMLNGIGGQLQRKAGIPMTATEPLVLTLWLKNEQPDVYQTAAHYMGVQEFVLYRLFGINVIDTVHAARTGFYNVETQTWDRQALAVTGLTATHLPQIITTTTINTPLLAQVAAQTNLDAQTTFYLR